MKEFYEGWGCLEITLDVEEQERAKERIEMLTKNVVRSFTSFSHCIIEDTLITFAYLISVLTPIGRKSTVSVLVDV